MGVGFHGYSDSQHRRGPLGCEQANDYLCHGLTINKRHSVVVGDDKRGHPDYGRTDLPSALKTQLITRQPQKNLRKYTS